MKIARALIASLLLAAPAWAGTPAPRLDPSLVPGAPKPYDESADATKVLDAAIDRARHSGKKLLIDFGGNWCPDCRMLAGVLDLPPVTQWANGEFEVVLIDVGRMNKNLDLAARFGAKITAVPTVLIATPDGKVLNAGEVYALSDDRSMSAQAVVDKLASWDAASTP